MLFEHALYLAIASQIGYANARTGPVPVIGMTTGVDQATGKVPSRMNINTLEQEGGPMWDLLIRGLDALQNKPEDDERSHFAVAGKSYRLGIDSPQLIPWHRAYLVLYEQLLGDEVQRLALEYSDEDASAYRDASQKLRLPYWDWASDPALPHSTTQENITVNSPNGKIVLHNPLYNYRWQTYPLNATQFPGQGGMGPVTTRNRDGDLQNTKNFIRDSVYRTFSSTKSYDQMASMAGSGSSFESPHNAIHNSVGGSFLSLDLTSFDSLFLLHHCNLDRLAAMWTGSHNDTLQTQPFTSQGLYSTAQGETITADSPLKPFYQADGRTFHTGRTVAKTETFGYTYPDILGTDQGRTKNVIAQINRLYGDITATEKSAAASIARREWFVDMQVDRADLPLPCSIDVYLGDQLAGRTLLLNMPKTGIAHDELLLSRVTNRLDANSNKSYYVERRLMDDLYVKVAKGNTTLDPRDIPSLHIKVVSPQTCPELFRKCLGPRGEQDKKVVKWNEGMCTECWDRFVEEAREMAEASTEAETHTPSTTSTSSRNQRSQPTTSLTQQSNTNRARYKRAD
ncbi:Di-copper centre-containing protein [Xylaria sp. FL1777]|nr:Di-copper centre-containing protein [Xylaria sp. FL1777]